MLSEPVLQSAVHYKNYLALGFFFNTGFTLYGSKNFPAL